MRPSRPSSDLRKTTRSGLTTLPSATRFLDWIRCLPPDHQDVIALVVDDHSTQEIAYRLQLPPAVVRSRLRAARRELSEAFVAQMAADRRAERAEQRAMASRSRDPIQRPRTAQMSSAEESTDPRDLADLPPRQQEVLRLSRRGYKPAQIAPILGLSPNTVRVNLFHARKRIRRSLELPSAAAGRIIA